MFSSTKISLILWIAVSGEELFSTTTLGWCGKADMETLSLEMCKKAAQELGLNFEKPIELGLLPPKCFVAKTTTTRLTEGKVYYNKADTSRHCEQTNSQYCICSAWG